VLYRLYLFFTSVFSLILESFLALHLVGGVETFCIIYSSSFGSVLRRNMATALSYRLVRVEGIPQIGEILLQRERGPLAFLDLVGSQFFETFHFVFDTLDVCDD